MPLVFRCAAGLALWAGLAWAQPYDLLLRGGHVLDPANQIDGVRDVAVAAGKIAAVAPSIDPAQAKKSVDVSGLYVTPGLIDLHAHVYGYSGSIFPDDTALPACTTTIVDAGGSGWRTFDDFKKKVIDSARTRVLVFVNIAGRGMLGEPVESDTTDMDSEKTAAVILKNPGVIVGIKTAHFSKPGWTAIDRAVEAGRLSNTPVMVDDKILTGSGRTTKEKLLEHLRPGDMHTHMYNDRQLELIDRFTRKVQPWMIEARKKGVLFDLGHGGGSFMWPVADAAMKQGFAPDTISTDLHSSSIMGPESDMPNSMSKMLILGMDLKGAVTRSTVNPAKAIKQFPALGTLSVGAGADIAVLKLETGVFAYKDAWTMKRLGDKQLGCQVTVRNGTIVWDREGRAFPDWKTAGEYEVIP